MLPDCLTQENFRLWTRARELLDQAIRSGPGERCNRPVREQDCETVSELTLRGAELCRNKNFAQAERVLDIAIKIQEWLYHPRHQDLASPLLVLGEVYVGQDRLKEAEFKFRRALHVSAETDARFEQQEMALRGLIFIFGKQGRIPEREQMLEWLLRVHRENRFVIKDRPNKRYE
jgi:tetratricopeptide (TPR) repeat protein